MEIGCPNCGTKASLDEFKLRKASDKDTMRLTVHKRKATSGDHVASCPKCGYEFIKHLMTIS